ncbi:MAG: alanine racemase [Acidobacteria bacterium]|nr:alanine racemase [Acidobacteriota bacterium]
MMPRAWAEVDVGAIVRNYRRLKEMVGPPTAVMAVVKADAYGHGAEVVARALHKAEPDAWFGVATVVEALTIRGSLPEARILLLSPSLAGEAEALVEARITPVVSSLDVIDAIAAAARRIGTEAAIHVEVDTGMGRCGLLPGELAAVLEHIAHTDGIRLEGLMTHFPDAENDPERSVAQAQVLVECGRRAAAITGATPMLHAANTAGALFSPASCLDMIRPGMALYGLLPLAPRGMRVPSLEPALTLKARVLLVRELPAGHPISYGSTTTLRRRSMVATLGIGYGDGYPRTLSNRGGTIIGGCYAPILGRVCMDLTVVDVTDIPGVRAGDTATLVGSDGSLQIRADELARLIGTTEHEITTCLSARVPRRHIGVC